MSPISARSAHLLAVLKDPLRLEILLALEERPRTSKELSLALELPYDQVNWCVRTLVRGGLAELVRSEPSANGQTMQKVYAARHRGWASLLPVLDAIAETA